MKEEALDLAQAQTIAKATAATAVTVARAELEHLHQIREPVGVPPTSKPQAS